MKTVNLILRVMAIVGIALSISESHLLSMIVSCTYLIVTYLHEMSDKLDRKSP